MRRKTRVSVEQMELSESQFCRSAALMHGAAKILGDDLRDGSGGWGPDITIRVAIDLLTQARMERTCARENYDRAYKPSNVKPKARKRRAGGKP